MNTNFFLDTVAGNVFGTKTSPAIPTKYYIGLCTNTPNVAGTTTPDEPTTASGYARVELTGLSAPTNGVVTNTADINFPKSVSSWGTVKCFVVYDSEPVGSGNLLMFGELSTSRTVEAATIMTIEAGGLTLQVMNPTT